MGIQTITTGTIEKVDIKTGGNGDFVKLTLSTNVSYDGTRDFVKKVRGKMDGGRDKWGHLQVGDLVECSCQTLPKVDHFKKDNGEIAAWVEYRFNRVEKLRYTDSAARNGDGTSVDYGNLSGAASTQDPNDEDPPW